MSQSKIPSRREELPTPDVSIRPTPPRDIERNGSVNAAQEQQWYCLMHLTKINRTMATFKVQFTQKLLALTGISGKY